MPGSPIFMWIWFERHKCTVVIEMLAHVGVRVFVVGLWQHVGG